MPPDTQRSANKLRMDSEDTRVFYLEVVAPKRREGSSPFDRTTDY